MKRWATASCTGVGLVAAIIVLGWALWQIVAEFLRQGFEGSLRAAYHLIFLILISMAGTVAVAWVGERVCEWLEKRLGPRRR